MEAVRTWNPLTLSKDCQFIDASACMTPNEIIEKNGLVFERPFYLLVNGAPVLRRSWDSPLPEGAVCHFVELPHGNDNGSNPLAILAMVAVVAVAAYAGGVTSAYVGGTWGTVAGSLVQGVVVAGGMMLINHFFGSTTSAALTSEAQSAETSYTLNSGRNTINLGQPFPEHFGRYTCYPNLIMKSYTEYVDHEQFFYMIGVLGVGEYDVEGVYIDKTPIGDYSEATYNVLAPGDTPTLCPNLVWICGETLGQELTTEWLTVVASAAGTEAHYIAVDFVYQSGLVGYNDRGGAYTVSVTVEVQARMVDDSGGALTGWDDSFISNPFGRNQNGPAIFA